MTPPDALPPFDPAAHGWERRGTGGFSELTGPFWAKREGEGRVFGLLTEAHHANGHGIIHGGLLVTMADNALGLTVFEAGGRVPCVTVQLNTHFISAAYPGEFIEARAEVLRRARSMVFIRGVLTVGDRTVAAADGVWKLLSASPARGVPKGDPA
ncbi:PaaI family thioesterase [Muricoccus radiodurans]|uniref:PaaI family thioesterase n=1 Tax=Muricoccus radiodurans TaxID=2231721 RepID=UPI003CF20B12